MMKIYSYCDKCERPIDSENRHDGNDSSFTFCRSCAAELLRKIYQEKQPEI